MNRYLVLINSFDITNVQLNFWGGNIFLGMKEAWDAFVEVLNFFGITIADIVPQVIILAVGLYVFNRFAIKPISTDISKTQKCMEDMHHASREMQQKLVGLISKTKGVEDWQPLHALESKLDWSTMNSPMFLNDKGKSLLTKSPMDSFIGQNEPELKAIIGKREPKTAYDVQEFAREALTEIILKDEEVQNKIKDFVYNNPIFEGNELDIGGVMFVGMLSLRDRYLDEHPELKETTFDGGDETNAN